MTINFAAPERETQLKPRIIVVGVGGAGGNAVNNMIENSLEGVEFMVANTDAQALAQSRAERRIQLGATITHGLGAGSRPDMGRAAAEEAIDETIQHMQGSHMVFIAAGMGGGTGTGAAPVIARMAREQGMLTVGVVTKPFQFEGTNRMRIAEAGIEEMQQFVDTLIVIPNQNLFRIANEKTTFADAFSMADDVLYSGVRGVTDLMVVPGLINLDFADIRTVMSEMGKAMMGTGEAEGDDRARAAAEAAISNPLLDDVSMKGARGVLINITGGSDMTLFEVDEAANRIGEEVDPNANIIFGSAMDPTMDGKLRVSVVATGIDVDESVQPRPVLKVYSEPVAKMRHTVETAPIPAERREAMAFHPVSPAAQAAAAPIAQAAPATPATEVAMDTTPSYAAATGTDDAAPMLAAMAQPEPEPVPEPEIVAEAEPVIEEEPIREEAPEQAAEAESAPAPEPIAEPVAEAAPEPVAAPEAPKEAFIPPPPVQVAKAEPKEQAAPDPYRAAALLNAGPKPAERKKSGLNLFQRMTGRKEEPQAVEKPLEMPAPKAPEPQAAAPEPAPKSAPAAVPTPAAPPAQQTRLDGVDPQDRLPSSQTEEDLLDIPAFLRRQAN
jgi:cell division protein FtsZ